jgi:hypothetical protein
LCHEHLCPLLRRWPMGGRLSTGISSRKLSSIAVSVRSARLLAAERGMWRTYVRRFHVWRLHAMDEVLSYAHDPVTRVYAATRAGA